MKTSVYKIITRRCSDKPFNREWAAKYFERYNKLGKAFGTYLATVKHMRLDIPTSGTVGIVRDNKQQYQDMMDRNITWRELQRTFRGKLLRASIDTETGGYKSAMVAIRRDIQYMRQQDRQIHDPIYSRPVGYYLKRYRSTVLSKSKHPTSDVDFTGIEIECIMPSNVDVSPLLPFGRWVNLGHDGSVEGDGDREEGREVRVCIERSEVRNVIPGLMEALKSMGAYVNKTCGLHVHLDQRKVTNPEMSFHKLVRSLGLLYTVVPKSRRNNHYCRKNRHADWQTARNGERYKAINATAYSRYRTIEVRLFGGTLEAEKIINWIEILWAIVNGAVVNRCPKNFDTAMQYWNLSPENLAWLKMRQAKFANLNTVAPSDESDVDENRAIREEQEGIDNDDSDNYDEVDDAADELAEVI